MSRNARAQALADDWFMWLMTRRFFAPPPQKHILARLIQAEKNREPPSAPLSAEMSAFNQGVIGMDEKCVIPFLRVYCGFPNQPVKLLAYNENINPDTFYERAHKGAGQAVRTMNHLMALAENMGLLIHRDSARQNRTRQIEHESAYY